MAEPRNDRLSREELELYQRRALRRWRESDWLAEHEPRAWMDLGDAEPDTICVDLGSGVEESQQAPGYIALDQRGGDIVWDLANGLPFEDQTVDLVRLSEVVRHLSPVIQEKLVRELARTLRVDGSVRLGGRDSGVLAFISGLHEHGFAPSDEPGVYELTQQSRPMADVAPPLERERVMGDTVIREPRRPTPS